MNIWQSLLLGFIQGVAEFLPISSSGHLVLVQNWLQINPPPFYFDVFIHLISLIAIIYYFRKKILQADYQLIKNIFIGTIPIVIIGLIFQKHVETIFASNLIAGLGLLVTAVFNFIAAKKYRQADDSHSKNLTIPQAFKIGSWQALAILPGISRSGSTIFGASLNKLNKQTAFEFSFMLAIPAILGANVVQLLLINEVQLSLITTIPWSTYAIGGLICFITSLFSLNLLKKTLNHKGYQFFGWYCLGLSLLAIIINLA